MANVLIRRGRNTRDTPREKATCGCREKVAACTPKKEASEENIPVDTLILDVCPLER